MRISLVLLDEVKGLYVNGRMLNQVHKDRTQRLRYPISAEVLGTAGKWIIHMEPLDGAEPDPVVFLEGIFNVKSKSAYRKKDDRQPMTRGPFRIIPSAALDAGDLIDSGLPFCG